MTDEVNSQATASTLGWTAASPGLTQDEASLRLAAYGPNVVPPAPPAPLWRRVLQQLRDPLILVLLVAAVLTVATGDFSDTLVIAFVVVVNTTVGVSQEVRAERAVAALSAMSAPAARVVRDGSVRSLAAAELVLGDVVLLAEGDVVPADGETEEAVLLLVDESSLTGESVPVDKAAGEEVSAGTVVLRGRARYVVSATGARSALGRIASLLGTAPGLTPLQHRLAGFGRLLAGVTVLLCTVVLVGGLVRGQPVELMVVAAISLAVAAVPESLPAVVTLSLALGARRMAQRSAIVRRLPAVETLGSVTLIASDKTGTLTEGRMAAERLWTPEGEAELTGDGYAPTGNVLRHSRKVTPEEAPDLTPLLTGGLLCNDAALQAPGADGEPWNAAGDPTEAALLSAGGRFGLEKTHLDRELPRVAEVPFDRGRKRMTTVHRTPEGELLIVCKGAPEVVLSAGILADAEAVRSRAAEEAERLAADGYRVLAVALGGRSDQSRPPEDPWESGLRLAGLIAIMDPPSSASAATVAACQDAGITPVMITGDHPLTARAVSFRLGISAPSSGQVTTGERIRDGTAGSITDSRVYARTSPEQKVDIVRAWRGAGHVVAMTGDGVNDGPALHEADIGVAMGGRGTEVARQAADLVLADDDLATVIAAVEEGRRIYANVRRFLLYGLAGGTAEILVMLLGPFAGMPLPLLPAQILWINLLTHGLPGVALGAEPTEDGVMRRPPRPPQQSVLGAGLWPRILVMGTVLGAMTLSAGVWAQQTGRPWQSVVFLVLAVSQLGVALGSRARPGTLTNPFLLVAVATALGLQAAALYLPPLRSLLGTEALTATELLVACAMSAVGYVVMRAQARLWPEKLPSPSGRAGPPPAGDLGPPPPATSPPHP